MLILLLRLIIFASVTIWSFLIRLIFSTIAYLFVLLIQGFKVPGGAIHGRFGLFADAIRAGAELFFELIMEAMNFIITRVFDVLKDSVTGSLAGAGSVIGAVAEKTKTSFGEALKDLPELLEELSDMVSKMVAEFWKNSKDALGYVTEHAA